MRLVVIYRAETDYARSVVEQLREFTRRTGRTVEEVDPDSSEGQNLCRTYDIVEYPTIIALTDDGMMLTMWRGLPLPTIDEMSSYVD